MRTISIIFATLFFLGGCSAKPEPCIPTVQYVEVKVPVVQKLKRPKRPKIEDYASLPEYVQAVKAYVRRLEVTIDGTDDSKRKKTQ